MAGTAWEPWEMHMLLQFVWQLQYACPGWYQMLNCRLEGKKCDDEKIISFSNDSDMLSIPGGMR